MLKRHYDYSSSNTDYHPAQEAMDSSVAMPGSVNCYTVT